MGDFELFGESLAGVVFVRCQGGKLFHAFGAELVELPADFHQELVLSTGRPQQTQINP